MTENSNETSSPQPDDYQPRPAPGSAVPYFLAFAVFVAALYGGFKWWQVRQFDLQRGQAIPASAEGLPPTDFQLTERSGEPFRSADMKGRVWVASYFFTTCPGSCIRINENIKFMHNLPELQAVTWLSITCDPDNDTVEVLHDYADRWEADPQRWLFGRAEMDYTQRVARGMNLFLSYKGHLDKVIVFDKAGKMRGVFDASSKTDCQRMRKLLLKLLDEEPPQELAAASDLQKKSS